MNSFSQFILLGNLSKDPEIKYTSEGLAITELRVAVNKKWKDKDGNENETVDFFNITTWNRLAENCASNLKKGDRVVVCGRLNHRSFETKDGKKVNMLNIVADVVAPSLEFSIPILNDKKSVLASQGQTDIDID